MKAWDIVAYAYNAALHCPSCSEKNGMAGDGAVDSEGNPSTPVFASDDSWEGEVCDDCGGDLE